MMLIHKVGLKSSGRRGRSFCIGILGSTVFAVEKSKYLFMPDLSFQLNFLLTEALITILRHTRFQVFLTEAMLYIERLLHIHPSEVDKKNCQKAELSFTECDEIFLHLDNIK